MANAIIKVYEVLCDTTFHGRFYRKGQIVQLTEEVTNVNFKFLRNASKEDKK